MNPDRDRVRALIGGNAPAKVYSFAVTIHGTAYVKASSVQEARRLVREINNTCLEVSDNGGDTKISGRDYDDPALPTVSLSPAMTIGDVGYHADEVE